MQDILSHHSLPAAHGPHTEHRFYPYTDNGGSTLGISGKDYVLLAGDTRHTTGFSINTRFSPKIFRIGINDDDDDNATDSQANSADDPRIVLAICGYTADAHALKERLDTAAKMYKYKHGKPIGIAACAKRLSTLLYSKRFFPFYVNALLAGVDENGVGALYSYDPVGSYERESCRSAGAASSLITPFLDNQVGFKNQYWPLQPGQTALQQKAKEPEFVQLDTALQLVNDAFTSATERQIEVGDELQVFVVSSQGVREIRRPLKKD